MIQETKQSSISIQSLRTFLGAEQGGGLAEINNGFIFRQMDQQWGMLIAWKTALFNLEAVEYGAFSLSAKLSDYNMGFLGDFMYLWARFKCWQRGVLARIE